MLETTCPSCATPGNDSHGLQFSIERMFARLETVVEGGVDSRVEVVYVRLGAFVGLELVQRGRLRTWKELFVFDWDMVIEAQIHERQAYMKGFLNKKAISTTVEAFLLVRTSSHKTRNPSRHSIHLRLYQLTRQIPSTRKRERRRWRIMILRVLVVMKTLWLMYP